MARTSFLNSEGFTTANKFWLVTEVGEGNKEHKSNKCARPSGFNIWFLATGTFQRKTEKKTGISHPSLTKYIPAVLDIISLGPKSPSLLE